MIHIGNARPMLVFDIGAPVQNMEYKGFEVNFVSLLRMVDDKIIKKAVGGVDLP